MEIRIKARKIICENDRWFAAGAVLFVSEARGKELVETGDAVEIKAPKAVKPTTNKKEG